MDESKSNGEVERAVQSVQGLASPLRARLVEHCSNLLLLFHKGEPHDGHTAYMRLKSKPWRIEMPSFGEYVDFRRRHKLESRWSRGVFVGVRVKATECIVMDETGTYVVQSVRRVPEEQRYDNKLLRNVRGTPWELNPGDVSTDLPEPMLIIRQLLDVEPTPTRVYNSDINATRNVYIRKTDLERFGYTASCRACEVHRAGQSMSGQEHTTECTRRLEDAMTTDTSTAARVEATRVRQAERIVRDLDELVSTNPSSSSGLSGSGQHKRVRFADRELVESRLEHDAEMQTGGQEATVTRKRSAEKKR